MFVVRQADVTSPAAASLIDELDEDLRARYPGAVIHSIDVATFHAAGGVFLIGDADGEPVACGALRPAEDGSGEVKRMFVRTGARRRGYARAMLEALESSARALGFRRVRLETGDRQPEAIRLYEASGYHAIPCFGEYEGSPHSRCFEKKIA